MKAIDYVAPRRLDEAVEVLAEYGDRAKVLAGGTDILVQLREYQRDCDILVDVKRIPELMELSFDPTRGLTLGAAVPCCDIYSNVEIRSAYPGLIDAVAIIGGIQIQSRASVGGNLCNASPAADTIPALIVHRAVCTIAGPRGQRQVPVEDFCTAPGKTVLAPGELLVNLHLPAPAKGFGACYLRFIPRNEMDIAVVGAGVSVTVNGDGKRCSNGRVALAAVAPRPLLVRKSEEILANADCDEELLARLIAACRDEASPITDMRGTAEFRRHLIGVLTRRALEVALERAAGRNES